MEAETRTQPWKAWVVVDESSTDPEEFVISDDDAQK